MNFKRFHESKNLFDKNATYTTGQTSYQYTITGLTPNQYYTCSTNFISQGVSKEASIYFNGGSTVTNGVDVNSPKTFRCNNTGTMFILVRFQATPQSNPAIYNDLMNGTIWIMLNEGSTPLPYEPYSSEVWHDIPYYIHDTSTDTITTLPADIYANAVTATVGLKGDMEQSSTPSPTNPIQPQECGERTGNLAWTGWGQDYVTRINDRNKASMTSNVLTFSANAGYGEYDTKYIFKTDWKSSQQYTISFKYKRSPSQSNATIFCIHYTDGSTSNFPGLINDGAWHDMSYTSTNGKTIKYITPYYSSGGIDVDVDTFMVNEDSTALPYEPYGVKIPISSASTTTPVYLGQVESTRQIKKLVLTGEETYTSDASYSRFITVFPNAKIEGLRLTQVFCTHFISVYDGRPISEVPNNSIYSSDVAIDRFFIKTTDYTSETGFKAFLAAQYAAGTPVTVWYVLATEETAVVNEPLRKIGDYADTVSGISIPTISGANSFDVLTTLKPSEVTANYHGWHPVADVHERESGAWT